MNFVDYWHRIHKKYMDSKIVYDNWLDNYQDVLAKCSTPILDLGCGGGNNTLYLTERGFKVVACDYSKYALEKIDKCFTGVKTVLADISQPLPFKDQEFGLIIADLSLHYFDSETTKNIMKELKRILVPGGSVLARVNSVEDINHVAGQGGKLEENFYFVEGYNKRFFTKDDAKKFFSIIGNVEAKDADMLRHSKPKRVVEIRADREM